MTNPELKSDINVTPLVDVCLVLLIIFMVMPMIVQEGHVELPATRDPQRMPEEERQVTVSLQTDGKILLGTTPVAEEGLAWALQETRASRPDVGVVIRGDRRLRYGQVRRVLQMVREAGFERAGLATERRPPPG